MIKVEYLDRLGNRLFQYCLGRILAESMGFALSADPIEGFPGTYEPISGLNYAEAAADVLLGHFPNKVDRQKIDLQTVITDKTPRKIIVEGYFQRYEYYQPHKTKIRQWLALEDVSEKPHAEDVVVHIRRTDDALRGTAHPFSYYEGIFAKMKYRKLYVCSDDYQDPFLKKFEKFNAVFPSGQPSVLDDFKWIKSFRRIILSSSTFGWWAAFLSQAEEIYFPLPETGYWGPDYPDIDLTVHDEARYFYVPCLGRYRRSLAEWGQSHYLSLRDKIKRKLMFLKNSP